MKPKFWIRMSFWNKIKTICAAFGISSEFTLFLVDSSPMWKIYAAAISATGILIGFIMEDNDNNGKVDMLENKPQI